MIKITFEAAYDKKTIYPKHLYNKLFLKNRRHMHMKRRILYTILFLKKR